MEVMLPPSVWFQDLVCKAVRDLGGSARTEEIYEKAIELGQFAEEQLAVPAPDGADFPSKVHAEMSSALTRAKADGRLDSPDDEIWLSV
jgi:hypothetical protein